MKHNISIAVAALAVTFAGCNARSEANKVTVAGCVQSAEQGLGSTDKKDIDKFMLTNVASSAAAAPAATPPAASGTPYMLTGRTSELREHLNHQVEITGRLDDAKNSSSQTIDRRPELHVDSVRMIAANCQ